MKLYTGCWWVGCYIYYSEEGHGWAIVKYNSPPINGQCTVPVAVLLYHSPLLCISNVPIKGLIVMCVHEDCWHWVLTYSDDTSDITKFIYYLLYVLFVIYYMYYTVCTKCGSKLRVCGKPTVGLDFVFKNITIQKLTSVQMVFQKKLRAIWSSN